MTDATMSRGEIENLSFVLNAAAETVKAVNVANGWHDSERTFGEDIALLHSEASEALEAFREHGLDDATEKLCPTSTLEHASLMAPHNCKPEGVGSELADVLIRLLDTAGRYGVDLGFEVARKLAYNETRGHRHGGKKL